MVSQVSQTILEQLGGRRFIVMTGAKLFIGSENSLSFRLPGGGGFCSRGINFVKITLMPSDTYQVDFYRRRGIDMKMVVQHGGVYCDQLQAVFKRETGLETSLGRMVS